MWKLCKSTFCHLWNDFNWASAWTHLPPSTRLSILCTSVQGRRLLEPFPACTKRDAGSKSSPPVAGYKQLFTHLLCRSKWASHLRHALRHMCCTLDLRATVLLVFKLIKPFSQRLPSQFFFLLRRTCSVSDASLGLLLVAKICTQLMVYWINDGSFNS